MKLFKKQLALPLLIASFFVWGTSNAWAVGTYNDSAHGDTTNGVSGRAAGYAIGNCAHCHDQHASRSGTSHTPHDALRGLSEENLCQDCHDSGGPPAIDDIKTLITKTYRHPTGDYSGRHTISQTLEIGQGGTPFQGAKRHAECSDCHNPHALGDTDSSHTLKSNSTATSDPLQGVWGVEPDSENSWGTATNTFTDTDPAAKEYQICFKCHSYYALQDLDGITALSGPSGQTITDQAMEFSTDNKSVHPVRVGLSSQTGSYLGEDTGNNFSAVKGLASSQLNASWNSTGTQTMYCSDCHGTENSTNAVGPHGSNNIYMLKGENGASNDYSFWPTNSADGTGSYFTIASIVNNGSSEQSHILCKKCHKLFDGSGPYNSKTGGAGGFYNYVHDKHYGKGFAGGGYGGYSGSGNLPCVTCHVQVPHGSPRSRLIGYIGDPAPYTVTISSKTFPVILGFKKASGPGDYGNPTTGYDKANCYISASICGKHPNSSTTFTDNSYD